MKKIIAASAVWLLMSGLALAQSSPNLTFGMVPTPAQWNSYFQSKNDVLGFTPMNSAGGVFTGRVVTAPPGASTAGFNLTPGTTPGSPVNGDLWVTTSGIFARINGSTFNLSATASLTAGSTLTSGYSSGQILGSTGSVLSAYSVIGTGSVVLSTSPMITTPSFTMGSGLTSSILASSTNTGFQNQISVANYGTESTTGTSSAFVGSIAGANAFVILEANGGGSPNAVLISGLGLTGGFNISAQAGTLSLTSPTLTNATATGSFTATGLVTAADLFGTSGTGNVVLVNSPTLITPALGTPSSVVLTNATGLPLTSGVTGLLPLANGGSNANLTASLGGIIYSTASAFGVLSGTVTANQCLLSGSLAPPVWGSCSGSGAAVSSVADSGASTLTISPTTGSVVAALNLAKANTWTNTVAISPTAASVIQGLTVNQTGPTSGTNAGVTNPCYGYNGGIAVVVYNSICINSEAANPGGNPPETFTMGTVVGMITGGTNSAGSKDAFVAVLSTNAASSPSYPRDRVALTGAAFDSYGEGGTSGSPVGDLFASAFGANATGATFLNSISGSEVDVGISSGSASARLGWSMVANGTVAPYTWFDTAFEIAGANVSGSYADSWKIGILLSSQHGAAGIATTGCAFCTDGIAATMATGIDFSPYNITGNFLKGPNGFVVTGTGIIGLTSNLSSIPLLQIINNHATAGDALVYLAGGGTAASSDTTTKFIEFNDAVAQPVGNIRRNGANAVAYVTTSDQRLKTALPDSSFGIEQLRQIKIHDFYFNNDITRNRVNGVFAQELYGIYPYAVSAGGDDASSQPWGVDYGRLTPLLVTSVQQEDYRISKLEADIDILREDIRKLKTGTRQ